MNIALIGYGKMGKAIEQIAIERGHVVVLKIDFDNQHHFTKENLQKADVAIEFTGPHSAFENVIKCLEYGVPLVCGSTGWLDKWPDAKAVCEKNDGALLYASNFSVGVNLFFEINKYVAALLNKHPEYNISMEEIHHTQKKDAPSGTAITLAEQILANNHLKKSWVNEAAATTDELSIISKRIDPAPGTHSIKYASAIDDIEITHTAHSRTGFATGAVVAAEFLKGKKGIFSMKEVLGL
jgi:4-hydroxy-tetrahydrodipicolinate reductase